MEGRYNFFDPIVIPPGRQLVLQVFSAPVTGHYHYHVYCEEVQDCAQGDSEPTLIVVSGTKEDVHDYPAAAAILKDPRVYVSYDVGASADEMHQGKSMGANVLESRRLF
jgi:hypothetical protein